MYDFSDEYLLAGVHQRMLCKHASHFQNR